MNEQGNAGNARHRVPDFGTDIGIQPVISLLQRLRAEQFYGIVELKYQKGVLQLTNVTTQLKPTTLAEQSRHTDDDDNRYNRYNRYNR